ncbi:MAG: hypothetical protein M1812_007720 [Candelaria pacifica]|nr:MAG: hypothetical protein M1812_007720 [Candelaria pacifica]
MQDLKVQPSANAFDDFLYRSEVLELANGQTEEAEDEALEREAIELGIVLRQPDPTTTEPLPPSLSTLTVESMHIRSDSSESRGSRSTGLTSRSSKEPPSTERTTSPASPTRKRFSRKSAFVTEYDKFLANAQSQQMSPSSFSKPPSIPTQSSPSILSDTSRRSTTFRLKRGLSRFSKQRKSKQNADQISSCVCCREDFRRSKTLHTLPCSHSYCEACLHTLSLQATQTESSMPPKCCSRPIPGAIVKAVLSREEQQSFLKSVLQFATPWEDRVFCPSTSCGVFIPKRLKVDPKHPFEVVCRNCKARACKTCKRESHPVGQDCPADWELEAVLQMGEDQGWRRCYKCRTLVSLSHGCTHMTCRCKAQFCYICGAVWDREVGCPNFCNGEEELERRRLDEENQRVASTAAAVTRIVETYEAMQRSIDNPDLQALRKRQLAERDRFLEFEQKQRWLLGTRHEHEKSEMSDCHADSKQVLNDQHIKTITTLEDRQVHAELDFRKTLQASRRACAVRLRHMEAYCHPPSTTTGKPQLLTSRAVTDRDLRELKQQYSLRDDMERLHESRINVLREKQAQQLEALVKKQAEELDHLVKEHAQEELTKESSAIEEISIFELVVSERKERLIRRWARSMEVARRKLELRDELPYGPLIRMEWGIREPSDEEDEIISNALDPDPYTSEQPSTSSSTPSPEELSPSPPPSSPSQEINNPLCPHNQQQPSASSNRIYEQTSWTSNSHITSSTAGFF